MCVLLRNTQKITLMYTFRADMKNNRTAVIDVKLGYYAAYVSPDCNHNMWIAMSIGDRETINI